MSFLTFTLLILFCIPLGEWARSWVGVSLQLGFNHDIKKSESWIFYAIYIFTKPLRTEKQKQKPLMKLS